MKPKQLNISGKFHRSDFTDMLIELYTYVDGSMKESLGITTKSDYIVYFTPSCTYVVDSEDLKTFTRGIKESIKELIPNFSELLSS